jgi:hypothetical protein
MQPCLYVSRLDFGDICVQVKTTLSAQWDTLTELGHCRHIYLYSKRHE